MTSPFPLAANCQRCAELVHERCQIVHGYGDPRPAIVFVGQAPERPGSDETGIPFTVSQRGAQMQQLLQQLGLAGARVPGSAMPALRSVYLTHVVRCLPPQGRAPSAREVAHCVPYLWHELAILRPLILVAVGDLAAQMLCSRFLGFSPQAVREIHAQIYHAAYGYLVPMLDPLEMSTEESLLVAHVLNALVETTQRELAL